MPGQLHLACCLSSADRTRNVHFCVCAGTWPGATSCRRRHYVHLPCAAGIGLTTPQVSPTVPCADDIAVIPQV